MEKDEELERIRRKKLEEMMKSLRTSKEAKPKIDKPIEVTDSNFYEVVKSGGLVVVDCWAAWCAPCRIVSPIIDELAREYAGKILFGKLNVDLNRKIPMEYQIMSIPTILIFKDGKLVDRIIGARPRRALESAITKYL
ncbi:thioredoxin [Candidatus Bathyarchaeota archaeon]|nr:thioredoxin [Candidatus Bathyarchaeota archaeon]